MKNLPNWTDRPEVTANLLNPAFCVEVMRTCMTSYKDESSDNFPFALSVFILPFILNNRIREKLPKTKATAVHTWINANEEFKVGLAHNIANFLPFTREAIMFGLAHHSLNMDAHGRLEAVHHRGKLPTDDEEIKSCVNKASLLGKVLAKSGNPLSIYSLLGIRP